MSPVEAGPHAALAWLSAAVFVAAAAGALWLHVGMRRLRQLEDLPGEAATPLPRLSVIVSALDEADTIEPALRSLLALQYEPLEVIAIDDRSTDATGAILDRLAQADPRLQVLHVRDLPAGWLGKTHAMHLGAQQATGEWLLFTDADVHFAPRALRQAVLHARRQAADHLVVMPQLHVREPLLAAVLLHVWASMLVLHRPWAVSTSPKLYLGLGAFNLVRSAAYHASGGHERLRLEVVDDLMLGRQLKLAGCRQEVLLGRDAVVLEWYRDTAGLARGLEKNSLAVMDYRLSAVLAGTLAVLVLRVWPWVGLAVATGAAWWCCLGAVVAGLLGAIDVLRLARWPRRCLAWWPVAPLVLLAILWRAALLTWRRGGIDWRGTFYPLAELKAFRRASRR